MKKEITKEVSLVKIDSKIYDDVSEIVKANPIDFPTIKNFIEIAVRNHLDLIKYNIGNREDIISPKGEIIPSSSTKKFSKCNLCSRIYFGVKKNSQDKMPLCPNCKKIIIKIASQIEE